jgi:pimeloyl-ACP methyl ester carboxylesterase
MAGLGRRSTFITIASVVCALVAYVWWSTRPTPPPPENTEDPRWVSQGEKKARVAVVFVHGLIGGTLGTWVNENGRTFFELTKASKDVGPEIDIFAFGFTSNMFKAGSLDIREAANHLHQSLAYHRVLDYHAVVFVAHSMGGLVVMRYLIGHRELVDKVPLMVLYATPQEGSLMAVVGDAFLKNPALRQMFPADGNALLQSLSDDWRLLPQRPVVRCGYEKLPTKGATIVPWGSSTRFCDGESVPISEADHVSIAKPNRPEHDSVVLFVNAFREHVVRGYLDARLELPDFVREGSAYVFTLTNPNGKTTAHLASVGRGKVRVTLTDLSDQDLYLWHGTPVEIPGGQREPISAALSGNALKLEKKAFRFVLKSDAAPDAVVHVRVPNVKLAQAERARLVNAALRSVDRYLAVSENSRRLEKLRPADPTAGDAVVRVVQESIAAGTPTLPPDATWILTAEVLTAANWPKLAVGALRNAETVSPATAQSPAGQWLAGYVAAQSGEPKVYATAETPAVSVPFARSSLYFLDREQVTDSQLLALRMQLIPALRPYGLSLQGDVLQARGDTGAARQKYVRAAAIQPTPSIASRIKSLDSFGSAAKEDTTLTSASKAATTAVSMGGKIPAAKAVEAAEVARPQKP